MKKTKKSSKQANLMWGGRFELIPSEIMSSINSSIKIDKRLYIEDIQGSKAHCQMLMDTKIIEYQDGKKIIKALSQIKDEIESGDFIFKEELEDIHMNIENRLHDIIGETAGRLHTARSRNDQVATDLRLWIKSSIENLEPQPPDFVYLVNLNCFLSDIFLIYLFLNYIRLQ